MIVVDQKPATPKKPKVPLPPKGKLSRDQITRSVTIIVI